MNALAMGWERTLLELKMYSREKEAVFFNFLFPILLLVMFSTIFGGQFSAADKAAGMNAGRLFLPGLIAAGVMLTSFQTMAMSVTVERDDGTLKRLRGTPMPPVAYFLGKVGLVLATSVDAAHRPAPRGALPLRRATAHRRGALADSGLGVLPRQLRRNRSRHCVFVARHGPLDRCRGHRAGSGVAVHLRRLLRLQGHPQWLQQVAALFPLKWVAQGMRSVFYPDGMAAQEMAHAWEPGRTALVLGAWAVGGLLLCAKSFSWYKRGTT
jgi:ABC-2 type transport system permease protein